MNGFWWGAHSQFSHHLVSPPGECFDELTLSAVIQDASGNDTKHFDFGVAKWPCWLSPRWRSLGSLMGLVESDGPSRMIYSIPPWLSDDRSIDNLSYGACKTKYRLHSVRKPRENMWYSTADDVAVTVCFPRLFSSLLAPECLVVCVGAYDLIFIHKTSQLSLALNCGQLMWPTYLKISPLQWFRVILIYIIAQFPSLAVPWAGVRQMACESKISWNKYDLLSEI